MLIRRQKQNVWLKGRKGWNGLHLVYLIVCCSIPKLRRQLSSTKPATVEWLNACISLLGLLECDWCHAVWMSLQPKHSHRSALYSRHWDKIQIFFYYDSEAAIMTVYSHQIGWLSWHPQISHTLSADPHDTHLTQVGPPTRDNTETTEINTLNG